MSVLVTNNGIGYLLVGINDVEEKVLLKSGQGSRFPSPILDQDWFYITVEDEEGKREVMKCTQRDGDTLTVRRGQDNTMAISFKADCLVELRPCAGLFNDKVDEDTFANTVASLKAQIKELELALTMKINNVQTTSSADLDAYKQTASETFLPFTGGELIGELRSNSNIITTAKVQAGAIAITPEPTE